MKAPLETNDERLLEQRLQTACARLRIDPDDIEISRTLSGSRWRHRAELPALEIEGFGPDANDALTELVENLEAMLLIEEGTSPCHL
jgi:hypothetical protein